MASSRAVSSSVVTVLALCLVGAPLSAQAPSPQLGVHGGVSFATVSGSDLPNTKSLTTFLFGAHAEIPVSDAVSIQPELNYAGRGVEVTGIEGGKIKVSYFQVPVLLRVNINTESGKVRPHLYAGPALGFKGSCNVTVTGSSSSEPCDDVVDLKGSDFSGVFGGGLDIGRVTIGARYDLGLTNITDNEDDNSKNRALSIYAAVGFPLKK